MLRQYSCALGALSVLLVSGCGEPGRGGDGSISNPPGPAWREAFWNPTPAEADLIIEGPCGSRFVFRPIETPTEANWLADMSVALGQSALADDSAQRDITEQVRQGAIVGGFADGEDPAKRLYYIGKYEVTLNQYQAVMRPDCQEPNDAGNIPVDKISRFDAVEFARRLSEFGFRHATATAALPKAGAAPAYVRLPTEAEWEFAARGGSSVSVEERLLPAYPMDGDLAQYEWHESDESCRGSLQPAGLLKPNPLGLHDMLGNVSEMVSDPFQINRGGRLHGQPGGVTAKGGSCGSPLASVKSAARIEFPDFDTEAGTASAPAYVGFRLALGAPAIPSSERLDALEQDWEKLRQPGGAGGQQEDPAEALRSLASTLDDVAVAQTIARQASAFDTEMARRAEVEAQSARMLVSNGAMLIRNYIFTATQVRQLTLYMDRIREAGSAPDATQVTALANAGVSLRITRDLYTQTIVAAADSFPAATLADAMKLVSADLRKRYAGSGSALPVADMACMFVSQANDFAARRPSTFTAYLDRIVQADPAAFAAECR